MDATGQELYNKLRKKIEEVLLVIGEDQTLATVGTDEILKKIFQVAAVYLMLDMDEEPRKKLAEIMKTDISPQKLLTVILVVSKEEDIKEAFSDATRDVFREFYAEFFSHVDKKTANGVISAIKNISFQY